MLGITPETLRELLKEVAGAPIVAMRGMHESMLKAQEDRHRQEMEHQSQLLKILADNTSAEADPLRKMREKDPQFPAFTGRSEHFLPWVLACQTSKQQRNLSDAVAIQYAILAMGDSFRGLLPPSVTFTKWDEFIQALKPKFMLHTAEWSLYLECTHWKQEADWPSFHAKIQTYRLFLDRSLDPSLLILMTAALPDYLAKKVAKPPLPTSLDEGIDRAWQAFHTCPPPMQPTAPRVNAVQSTQPVTTPGQMELDTLRASSGAQLVPVPHFPSYSQFNVFTGKPMTQTFGRSSSPAPTGHPLAQLHAIGGYSQRQPRSFKRDDRREDKRDDRRADRRGSRSDSRDRPSSQERSSSRSSRSQADTPRPRSRDAKEKGRYTSPYGKDRKDKPRSRDKPSTDKGKEKAVTPSDRRACFICGDPKHWARECPHREELLLSNKAQKERKSRTPSPSPSNRAGKESGR
jgi:hypothetical protein